MLHQLHVRLIIARVLGWVQSSVMSMSVCLSVCSHNSKTTQPNIISCCASRVLVLLWRRCDTLCTSGFMDGVVFLHNGPIARPVYS